MQNIMKLLPGIPFLVFRQSTTERLIIKTRTIKTKLIQLIIRKQCNVQKYDNTNKQKQRKRSLELKSFYYFCKQNQCNFIAFMI